MLPYGSCDVMVKFTGTPAVSDVLGSDNAKRYTSSATTVAVNVPFGGESREGLLASATDRTLEPERKSCTVPAVRAVLRTPLVKVSDVPRPKLTVAPFLSKARGG